MIERFQELWFADDRVAVHRMLFRLGNCRGLSVDEILSLFELPPIWRERFSDGYEVRLSSGEVILRWRHEDLVWALGEALRQALKGKKERRDPRIALAITAICRDASYKKGRESFVMLFGDLQLKGFGSLEQKIHDVGDQGLVLFLFAAVCALWAQNTGRSGWLWFFLGLFFSLITVLVLLAKNSGDIDRRRLTAHLRR